MQEAATCHTKQLETTAPGLGIHQMAPPEHTLDKQAYYSFINPGRMKG